MKYFSKGFLCFLFCCCFLLASSQRTDPTEVDTLRIIWNHLVDINGNLSNWNRGDPCSSKWTGVMCSTVDGYLHVQRLHLMNMSLAGRLVPEIGNLSHLEILDFMWNNISGPIPKEIGNIKTLRLLLLNGNQLTGHLPEELGYLPVLNRIQIDQNNITGPIPLSFANLTNAKHFHMNNNSLSGQIPSQLSGLRNLLHLLLDNNNLSGHLPDELAEMPSLNILQLDNNNFGGNSIPDSYSNMSKLLKLSLRNCNLTGPIPDLSRIPHLGYLDLSFNQLSESIPSNKLFENITTIDLSNNKLNGTIPSSFSDLPRLQKLSISNNELSGDVPSSIWQNKTLNGTKKLFLDMKNNRLTSISGSISNLPSNITILLEGNPICSNNNNTVVQFCGTETENDMNGNSIIICPTQPCPPPYEYSLECVCVVPLLVNYRLKSPGFSDFNAYVEDFESFLTSGLNIDSNQLFINSFVWEDGRLRMYLKLFPVSVDNTTRHTFNQSEVIRLRDMFREWDIHESDLFGPYELLDFVLLDPYKDITVSSSSSGISKGALVGIVLGAIACSVTLSVIVAILIFRIRLKDCRTLSTRRKSKTSKSSIKIDGVRTFNYEEMALATNNFSQSAQVGQGGYGKVYKGNLPDGTVVAIKRAQEGSLQGEKEFLTEIQLLSRLHHRNLVSLIGYCDEDGEQSTIQVPAQPKPFRNKTKKKKTEYQMAANTNDTVEIPEKLEKKNSPQAAKGMETSLPDPLILHHSDTPAITLVNKPLNGRNYGEWSRAMRLSLSAKNKLGLIGGTVKAPSAADPRFPLWQRCNDLVLTWILHSIEPDIARSVIFSDTAAAVWSDLHDRFSQGDDSRIYQIRQEISECRQGSLSISDYYTKLKSLWDELGSYQEPIACSCDMLKKVAVREEKEKVMQFLMGLNESYSQVRGSILMMSPLPDTRKVHGLILQQERQMEVATRKEIPLASHAMQIARTPAQQTGKSFSNRRDLKCTYCELDGHDVDGCYYLKGFPVGHKWHGKNVKPRNKKASIHNIEVKRELTNDSPTFTAEEYRQIMAMLRSKNGNDQPLANASGRGYEEDDWPGQAF